MKPSCPSQAPMAQYYDGEGVDRMDAEADGDEGGGVVERRLHWVHVGPGEGRGVVRLAVEAVDLPVEELADVGDVCGPPGVHGAVHEVEVRDPVVGQQDGQQEVEDRRLCQGAGEG